MQELSSFIINPIQQLPRYIMLLSDLLRNTASDHPDHANIGIALDKMKKLTEDVNEKKRESETTAAIVNVQHRLRGKYPSLLIPFRRFVKEGAISYLLFAFLEKYSLIIRRFGDVTHGIKEREGYIFLFNDTVVLAKQTNKKGEVLYKYKDQVSTKEFILEDLPDEKSMNSLLRKILIGINCS